MKNVSKNIYSVNKKEGETPLECLEVFRIKKKISKDVPMTYAGRLDPMASGLMIILAGDECKNKEQYLKLDKEYEFSVLFGFATDTYDILGKIDPLPASPLPRGRWPKAGGGELEKEIKKNLKYFKGKFMQKYPMYSSKTVDGKQLHAYARSGEEVEAPEHEVNVKSLKFLKIRKISSGKLLQNIEKRINKVNIKNPAHSTKGAVRSGKDFRQKEILKIWQTELSHVSHIGGFYVADFHIKCTSGTYVRAIANDLGKKIDIPALAYSIKRTKVGRFAKIS